MENLQIKVFVHGSTERCDLCNKQEGKVYDNEVVTRHSTQIIRFFAHTECKKEMFRLLTNNGK